jgi:hypothetical protein
MGYDSMFAFQSIIKMIEIFKTNILKKQHAQAMIEILSKYFPDSKINFDLSDCDKILRVEGKNVQPETIIGLLNKRQFECEVLM